MRNHTAPFEKRGARAKRIAEREVTAFAEQEVESYVRSRMQPQLTLAARQALSQFKRERGR